MCYTVPMVRGTVPPPLVKGTVSSMYDELLAMFDSDFYADVDAGLTGADDSDDSGNPDHATYAATRYFTWVDGITATLDDGVSTVRLDGRVTYFLMASGERQFLYHARVTETPYRWLNFDVTLARTPNEYGDWVVTL